MTRPNIKYTLPVWFDPFNDFSWGWCIVEVSSVFKEKRLACYLTCFKRSFFCGLCRKFAWINFPAMITAQWMEPLTRRSIVFFAHGLCFFAHELFVSPMNYWFCRQEETMTFGAKMCRNAFLCNTKNVLKLENALFLRMTTKSNKMSCNFKRVYFYWFWY